MNEKNDKKVDRRIRKTRILLRQGLAKLMLQKSIKEITVKELTDLVDINRSTFYLHYRDIYDMVEKIENDILEEFQMLLDSDEEEQGIDPPSYLFSRIYKYLIENADLCAVFLGKNGDIVFMERLKEVVRQRCFLQWSIKYADTDSRKFECFYSFIIGGHIGLIQNWLDTGMKESPEEIAHIAEQMTLHGEGFLQ